MIILISGIVSGTVVSISSLRINGDDGCNDYGGGYNNNSNEYHEGKSVRDENHAQIIIILIIIITTITIRIRIIIRIITTVVAKISLEDNNKFNPYIEIKNEIIIIIIH